jgi:hypothetical protein
MAERKKSGNIFGGSLLNVDGQGIYTVKKFQLILNKSRKSLVLEPTPTPTPGYPIVTALPTPSNEPTPTPTETPTPTPTPTPVPPLIVSFGSSDSLLFPRIGGYSLDYSGNTWTLGNTSTPNGFAPNLYKGLFIDGFGVATDGNMWVSTGIGFVQSPPNNIYQYSIGYSFDGISWTGVTDSYVSGDTTMTAIAYGFDSMSNPRWISVGANSRSISLSSDGINWLYPKNLQGIRFRTVCYGLDGLSNPIWLVAGEPAEDNMNCRLSPDGGNSWIDNPIVSKNIIIWSVSYCQLTNTWLAGYQNNTVGSAIATSSDGMNWNPNTTTIFFNNCYGFAFSSTLGGSQGRWVACGDGQVIVYSDDSGMTWFFASTPPNTNTVSSVCWNGQYFIAVGVWIGVENIWYSSDGDIWFASTTSNLFRNGLAVASIPGPDMYPSR